MAINDYTDNISAIEKDEKNQKADLKLSQAVSEAYIAAMTTFHLDMESNRSAMTGLENIGDVGSLASANMAKTALRDAVTGLSGVQITTNQHLTYLGELAKAVKSAHDLLIKSG